jgi:hypothetical protein
MRRTQCDYHTRTRYCCNAGYYPYDEAALIVMSVNCGSRAWKELFFGKKEAEDFAFEIAKVFASFFKKKRFLAFPKPASATVIIH